MNTKDFDLFFEDPSSVRPGPGHFGILYLLRRDINRCLVPGHGSWLGAMGIFAGIDLLGKFLEGIDDYKESGKCFKKFVRTYFVGLGEGDVTVIYQLRNSLLHSFGLYSRDKVSTEHRFCLAAGAGRPRPLIETQDSGEYLVDVVTLHREFERAIDRYKQDLLDDKAGLREHFTKIFPNYGETFIGPIPREPTVHVSTCGTTSGKEPAL